MYTISLYDIPINNDLSFNFGCQNTEALINFGDALKTFINKHGGTIEVRYDDNTPIGGTGQPHRCPVCGGNGLVPSGFYDQVSGEWWSSDASSETCRSCNGTGIVWG